MPHNVPALLEDVRRGATLIQQFTAGRSLTEYRGSELLRSAVERQFIIIGEALSRLEKLDTATDQITDHRKIIDFRNVLVHGYDVMDPIFWTGE
jgi:uncharacterized protein with HEPN domain